MLYYCARLSQPTQNMLYHVEIEFTTADGYGTETRVFKRAHTAVFEDHRVLIKEGTRQLFMANRNNVVRFECETLADRVDQDGRDEMDAACAEHVADGRRIPAIKLVRDTLGYGLREAKDYVDTRWPYVNPLDAPRLNPALDPRNDERADFDDIPF